ncbi:MAG: hypothetical protein IID61_18955, partial [SAR324 cluster bacterium]|nr:hypothetical protein [SAR324 cluster bacterium]
IVGDGLSFSKKEKEVARNVVYNINSMTGIAGDVDSSSFQIGDHNTLIEKISEADLQDSEKKEIKNIIDEFINAEPKEKEKLREYGIKWIGKNYDKLGKFVIELTKLFTS